ncbi:hypothetical protein BSKO_12570 [Bryopsis sp. KO-2023]|nr:hypothetical protein BSKO_12570 [Bryopsis sp. KO-2023]
MLKPKNLIACMRSEFLKKDGLEAIAAGAVEFFDFGLEAFDGTCEFPISDACDVVQGCGCERFECKSRGRGDDDDDNDRGGGDDGGTIICYYAYPRPCRRRLPSMDPIKGLVKMPDSST